MASASLTTETVVTKLYTLKLTEEETRAVAAVLATVGGRPTDTYRKHTQGALEALERAGVSWFDTNESRTLNGSLSWEESE